MTSTLTRTLNLGAPILCVIVSAFVLAEAQPATVQIIPAPKQLTQSEGRFDLRPEARLVLADSKSVDDHFAAQDFIDDVKQAAGVNLKFASNSVRHEILIGQIDLPRIQQALKRAGADPGQQLADEGYVLVVGVNEVVVAGKTPTGTFYGLQTLKQLVRGEGAGAFIPGAGIVDWPTMRWRAVSDDISRGPVPTVDYIKRQIRTEAFFKMNMHSFYMEHTFRSESHPLIGPAGGSLTPAEIRELVAYARHYHVELVPEQQTFGHLHKALRLEKYAELAETPYGDVLSPQQNGSYKLIADWYKELNDLFPGQFFHIGEDETFEPGRRAEQGSSQDARSWSDLFRASQPRA